MFSQFGLDWLRRRQTKHTRRARQARGCPRAARLGDERCAFVCMHSVVQHAAAAAAVLAGAVSPSLGPLARDQVIVNSNGATVTTCHGDAILRALESVTGGVGDASSPMRALARPLYAAAASASRVHGDGVIGTTVALHAALQTLASLFPDGINDSRSKSNSTSTAASSAQIAGLDSSLLPVAHATLVHHRTAVATLRIRRLAAALATLRRDALPLVLCTSARIAPLPRTLGEAWLRVGELVRSALAGKYAHGAVVFFAQLVERWLRESAAAHDMHSPVTAEWTAAMARTCSFYAAHLSVVCVLVPGAPLRDSSLAQGVLLSHEIRMPLADGNLNGGVPLRRIAHAGVVLLTRDFHLASTRASEITITSQDSYVRALLHAHERVDAVCRFMREVCGVRLVVCRTALSDATQDACTSHGIACIQGAQRAEFAALAAVTGARLVAPECVSDAARESCAQADSVSESVIAGAGVESASAAAADVDVHLWCTRIGCGRVRLVEALSLGAQRPAVRVMGDAQHADDTSGAHPLAHSLLLRAPHEAIGAQYHATVLRLLRMLSSWCACDLFSFDSAHFAYRHPYIHPQVHRLGRVRRHEQRWRRRCIRARRARRGCASMQCTDQERQSRCSLAHRCASCLYSQCRFQCCCYICIHPHHRTRMPSTCSDAWTLVSRMCLAVPRLLFRNAGDGADDTRTERSFQQLMARVRDFNRAAVTNASSLAACASDGRSDEAAEADLGLLCDDPLHILRGWSRDKGDFTARATDNVDVVDIQGVCGVFICRRFTICCHFPPASDACMRTQTWCTRTRWCASTARRAAALWTRCVSRPACI